MPAKLLIIPDPSVTRLVETSGAYFQQDVSTSVTIDIDIENMASGIRDDISSVSGGDSNFDFELTFSDKNLETDSSGTKYGSVSGFVALAQRQQSLNAGNMCNKLFLHDYVNVDLKII